ncbi:MAG: CinA family protein [Gammaproteobacteria bacterium]|nr:CinA family protein [Gammaproteobacteria bacterium]
MNQNGGSQVETVLTELAQIFPQKSLMLVTAESCTGGGVAYEVTSIPGSSGWFERGFVTYSNLSKIQMLGVKESALEQWGAVSREVVRQMAEGAIQFSDANISLSITGIAGPEGDSEGKPVGTCWFGWSGTAFGTISKEKLFSGGRKQVRNQAILFSLQELLTLVKTHF